MSLRELLHLFHITDVHQVNVDAASGQGNEFLRRNVEHVLATRRDHEIGTGLRQPQRNAASDSRAAAGY